jgi:hypothetical protein
MGILTIYILTLVILGSGFLCERLVMKHSELSLSTEWAWTFGVGLVLWSYSLFLWNFMGAHVTATGIRAVLFVSTLVIFFYYKQFPTFRFQDIRMNLRERSWPEQISLSVLVLGLLTSWMQACSLPIYHLDAVMHFGVDAKALFHLGTYRAPFFFERGLVHNQPEYPLLVPYLEALFYWLRGFADDLSVRHLFFAIWIAFLGLLYRGLRERLPPASSWLVISIFGTLPLFTADNETQVVSGCADTAFAFYWTGMILSGVHILQGRGRPWMFRLTLFSLGVVFLKPQGWPVSWAAWFLLILALGKPRWKEGVAGFARFFALALPWLWTAHTLPREITFPPVVINGQSFAGALERIGPLTVGILLELTRLSDWGIFWIVVAICIGAWRSRPAVYYFLVPWAAQFLIYMSVYLLYPQPVSWWIASSLSRWLVHGAGLITLAVAWA